ncbi:MAG: S1C family serine protease [Candidatus Moranbacteria bacterium]|nr:S1C family serine protease [Candidatus Moranbacteria bacterium]
MNVVKKIGWILLLILFVAFFGGVGSVVIDRYLIPKFAGSSIFYRFAFLKKATENTTIINKTEQVVVREDDSVEKIASQATTAVVKIVSVSDNKALKTTDNLADTQTNAPAFVVGSGVLVTNDGFIVTYRKAITEKSATYTVMLFNGATHEARLLGIDPLTNLAYLKIQADNVPAISFSNSGDVRSGKKLIALAASSQGYQNQFSTALLNTIDKTFNLSEKTVSSSEKLEGVFTMDFPNQKDYVGGPVINYNGEMVGLVGWTEMDNQKQYFVLPSNTIKSSLDLALRDELSNRPVLGLYYLSITKEMSLAYRFERDYGALVYSPSGKSSLAVIAGSPADQANFSVNDIILAVNGKEINLDNPLSVVVSQLKKGDTAEFLVLRNKEEIKISVTL